MVVVEGYRILAAYYPSKKWEMEAWLVKNKIPFEFDTEYKYQNWMSFTFENEKDLAYFILRWGE